MRNFFQKNLLGCTIAVAMAFPALAEITAQDIKDQIVGFYESVGYEVQIGSEKKSGNTLILSDISLVFEIPEDGGTVVMAMDTVELVETGDGAVNIVPSAVVAFNVNVSPDGDDEVIVIGNLNLEDMIARASGSPDALKIASTASGTGFKITSLEVDGETIPLNLNLSTGALASNYSIVKKVDDRRRFSGDSSIASIKVAANAHDPEGDGFFALTASMADLFNIFSFEAKKTDDIEDMLKAGFDGDVSISYGASAVEVNFQDGEDRFAMTGDATGGKFAFALSPDAIGYEISEEGVNLNISSSELPIPALNVSYDEFAISFGVPMSESDQPSDFHIRTALRGFSISEAIWSMFDPGQALPRDPATIVIELTGKLRVLVDLLDPDNIDELDDMDSSPFLPVSIDLKELTASFGGAFLSGTGGMTFDPESPIQIEGIPMPAGEVNLSLKGGFGLLDKLVEIGLMPPDASMGMRAMLGAFARPVGDDEFESKIEMTEDGGILANGQRLQ